MPARRLPAKGLYNARDLGGFPTSDGHVTRFGVFLRSEAPCGLPEEDIDLLLRFGVTASMDFRSTAETKSRPSDLAERLPYYHRPLFNEAAMAGSMPPPVPGQIGWGEQYIQMAEESRQWARDVMQIAAENQGVLLYHCTTGKDRTGLMTCYLLSVSGVGRLDIAADYCVSQVLLEPVYRKMREEMAQFVPSAVPGAAGKPPMPPPNESFFETPAEAMLTLIDYLTETYGGVADYLRRIGVPEAVLRRIREKFVE